MTRSLAIEKATLVRPSRMIPHMASIGLVAVVILTTFADYLSSWLPPIGPFPTGAILRDGFGVAYVGLSAGVLAREHNGGEVASFAPWRAGAAARAATIPFILFAFWCAFLVVIDGPSVSVLLAVRNLLLYPAIGFATYVFLARRMIRPAFLIGLVATTGVVAAILGIADTATHGRSVEVLGYRRDYSGVVGGAAELISGPEAMFGGFVRAAGGISNALVFGYLMAALSVLSVWLVDWDIGQSRASLRRTFAFGFLAVLTGIACISSLTRGAMIAAVVAIGVLVILRHNRRVVIAAFATIALSVLLTWASSGFLSSSLAPGEPDTSNHSLVDSAATRVLSTDSTSRESSSLRIAQIRSGMASLKAHPFGNGLGSEGAASNRAATATADIAPDIFAMIVALQTGIVGVALYGLIFGALIVWAIRRWSEPNGSLVLSMLTVFGVSAVLSASPDAPVFATTIWLLILGVSQVPTISRLDGALAHGPLGPPD